MTFLTSTNPVVTVSGITPISSTEGSTPIISIQDSTTEQKGAVQLEDSHTSTSVIKAATSKSVKDVYDYITITSGTLKIDIDGKSDIGHVHVEDDITDLDKYTQDEVDSLITTISGKLDDHNELNNLDYISSGHTGFQPAGDYVTDSELTSVSGVLQINIDGKSDTVHIHDDRYYTETELDAGQLDNRYYTEAEVNTISGTLQTNIDAKPDTFLELTDTPAIYEVNKYLRSTTDGTEWATVSGADEGSSIHSELSNLAYADSGHTGFASSDALTTVSGVLQANIDGKSDTDHIHDDRYYTESEVDTISGSLQADINYVIDVTNYADSPMIITGGEVGYGTNTGTFKVGALTALIRTTDSSIGELAYVTKTEEDNIAIPLADTLYYVIVNYNGGSPTIGIITNLQNFNDNIPIGSVMRETSNMVHYISGCFRLQNGVAKLHFRAFELQQLKLSSGNTIAYSGTNNFTMTTGVIYEGINRITQGAFNSATESFLYIYQNGTDGWTTVSGNAIDYDHYDDGDGTLGDVGVSKYGCHWVYRHIDDDDVYVLYGRGSYSLAEAEASQIPTGPDHLTNFGCLIGRIIAPEAGGSFTSIQMATETFFTGASIATHNNLGGLNDGDYKHLTASEYSSAILDRASPGNIGGIDPGSGDFTTLTASTDPVDENGVGDRNFNDNRYYIQSKVNTISGTLQTNIDGKADTSHIHDDRYYTESEVDDLITTISGKLDDHNELNNLDYASSGHTGFQPAGDYLTDVEFSTHSGTLQSQIDDKADIVHTHDDRYYTETEVDTISGSLQTNIDSKAVTLLELTDTPSSYDNNKYLQSTADGTEWSTVMFTGLVDTPTTYSGHSGQYLKVASNEVELEYTDISSGTATTTVSGWSVYNETTYYSDFEHNLSTNEISVFIIDTITNKKVGVEDIEVIDTDTIRIYVIDDTYSLKVSVITGGLVNTNHTHDDRYYTEAEVDAISNTLQADIDSKSEVTSLLDLSDTPTTYSGAEDYYLKTTISGIEFSEYINPSYVLYVAENGNDNNTGKEGNPFLTVRAAMESITDASVNNRYVIKVMSGVYQETATINMKDYVSVQGMCEKTTIIIAADGENLFNLSQYSILNSIKVKGATSLLINGYDGSAIAYLYNINIGECVTGVLNRNANSTIEFTGCYCEEDTGTITDFIKCTAGLIHLRNGTVYANPTITRGLTADGNTAQINVCNFSITSSGVADAFYVDNGGGLAMFNTLQTEAINGVHIGNNGTGSSFIGRNIHFSGATYDIYNESATAVINLIGADMSRDKINTVCDFNSTGWDPTEVRFRREGDVSIGMDGYGHTLQVGEGGGYKFGVRTVTCSGTTYTEVPYGDDIYFPSTVTGTCIYFGEDKSYKFYGLSYLMGTTNIDLGTGSIIWEYNDATNGWQEFKTLNTLTGYSNSFNSDSFTGNEDEFHTIRFDQDIKTGIKESNATNTGMSETTINSILGMWVRCRIDSPITTSPVFKTPRAQPNYMSVRGNGTQSFHGEARAKEIVTFPFGDSSADAADATLNISSNISYPFVKNSLRNVQSDAIYFKINIIPEMDTSSGLCIGYVASTNFTNVADKEAVIYIYTSNIKVDEYAHDGANAEVVQSCDFEYKANEVANKIKAINPIYRVDISELKTHDMVYVMIKRVTAEETNPIVASIDFVSLKACYYKWQSGESLYV